MKARLWTEDEDLYLEVSVYLHTIDEIAKTLDRSTRGIYHRIYRNIRPYELSIEQARRAIGVDFYVMRKWLRRGYISEWRYTADREPGPKQRRRNIVIARSSLHNIAGDPLFAISLHRDRMAEWLQDSLIDWRDYYVKPKWFEDEGVAVEHTVQRWARAKILPTTRPCFWSGPPVVITPKPIAYQMAHMVRAQMPLDLRRRSLHYLAFELTRCGWDERVAAPRRRLWNWPMPRREL